MSINLLQRQTPIDDVFSIRFERNNGVVDYGYGGFFEVIDLRIIYGYRKEWSYYYILWGILEI